MWLRRRHHHIRLNSEFKADLAWWHVFAAHWNGSSLLVSKESPQTTLTSDASGQWGYGAWHNTQWFQLARDQQTQDWHITAKELIPIVIAAVIWGEQLKGKRVLARCDNTAVVAVLNTRYAKDVVLMRILRCLFVVEAHFQFSLTSTHIPGVHNVLADDLSRNRLPSFQVTCQMLIVPHLYYPPLFCSGCFIPIWTGHPPAGQHCSVLLFSGHSPIHKANI